MQIKPKWLTAHFKRIIQFSFAFLYASFIEQKKITVTSPRHFTINKSDLKIPPFSFLLEDWRIIQTAIGVCLIFYIRKHCVCHPSRTSHINLVVFTFRRILQRLWSIARVNKSEIGKKINFIVITSSLEDLFSLRCQGTACRCLLEGNECGRS